MNKVTDLNPTGYEPRFSDLNENKVWVVEYSVARDSWHIDYLVNAIKSNIEFAVNKRTSIPDNDYKIVGIVDTINQAHDLLNRLKIIQAKRNAA